MNSRIAVRVDTKGQSRPAWMDAPPRVTASSIAALRKEKERILCLLEQKEEKN